MISDSLRYAFEFTDSFEERFWSKVNKTDGCWFWVGARDSKGYGNIKAGGKRTRTLSAHRASWLIHVGFIPEGSCVLHNCDTPACIRIDHLFLGTCKDNTSDMCSKGRQARGERHGMNKLTEIQVREIRDGYKKGVVSQKNLADRYGVRRTLISLIILRKRWSQLA